MYSITILITSQQKIAHIFTAYNINQKLLFNEVDNYYNVAYTCINFAWKSKIPM